MGVLTFHADPRKPTVFQQLSRRSEDFYPAIVDEVTGHTGERVDYRANGQLMVALSEEDEKQLEAFHAINADLGVEVERPTPEECRLLEPSVNPSIRAALYFPGDAWVDNTALTLALALAAEASGVMIERASVEAIDNRYSPAAVVCSNGRRLSAEWIVISAGCWSGKIAGVPLLPVEPVRGQALAVEGRRVRRVVLSPRVHLVPKGESQTMIGATVEKAGFDGSNTLGGISTIAAAGLELSPSLREAAFLGAWAGLRPGTPDDLPIIGPLYESPNLIAATGHFRNGILLAPITAEAVRDLILGETPGVDLRPLSSDRPALVEPSAAG